jgi:hypothetical protein
VFINDIAPSRRPSCCARQRRNRADLGCRACSGGMPLKRASFTRSSTK